MVIDVFIAFGWVAFGMIGAACILDVARARRQRRELGQVIAVERALHRATEQDLELAEAEVLELTTQNEDLDRRLAVERENRSITKRQLFEAYHEVTLLRIEVDDVKALASRWKASAEAAGVEAWIARSEGQGLRHGVAAALTEHEAAVKTQGEEV